MTDDKDNFANQIIAAVKLSRLPGVGAKTFKALVDRHGLPSRALEAHPTQLELDVESDKTQTSEAQLEELARALRSSTRATFYGARDYPLMLARTPEPPPYLFFKGALWPLPPISVAIVGARECTDAGWRFANTLARELAAAGVVVISGGARGIDTAAHKGALEAGGHTAIVTATGLDRVYPPESELLFAEVERRGAIITELLPGTPPRRDFFPTRNRIIVGLSDAVVIVEGRPKSGTFSSARHARKLGRPIFTWTGSPHRELSELPARLVEEGASVLAKPERSALLSCIKPLAKT